MCYNGIENLRDEVHCFAILSFRSGLSYDELTLKIKQVSHDLWEKAGRPEERCKEFWYEAERQLLYRVVNLEEMI